MSLTQAHEVLRKMLPELQGVVFKRADSDELVVSLKGNPPAVERKALWDRLKVTSFVRPVACVYALGLLELVLVTKFNLVGRFVFNEGTVTELPGGLLLRQTQQSYVALARRSLLGNCIDELIDCVATAVTDVFGEVELSKKISSSDLVVALMRIRRQVESNSESTLRKLLVKSCTGADANMENWGDGDNLTALLAEEMDILESNDTATVLGEINDCAFESLEKLIYSEIGDESVAMPKVLPKLANMSNIILSETSPVVSAIEQTPLVKQYAAVVYLSGELPR